MEKGGIDHTTTMRLEKEEKVDQSWRGATSRS